MSSSLVNGEDELVSGVFEPFSRLITQGMVHGKTYIDPSNGRFLKPEELDLSNPSEPRVATSGEIATVTFEKMSKSKYNGVDPTETIGKYGADATRAHMLFQAPISDILNWDEEKIQGVTRWLSRLHEMVIRMGNVVSSGMLLEDNLSVKEYFEKLQDDTKSTKSSSDTGAGVTRQWDNDAAVWRDVQKTIVSVTSTYTSVYSMNTVVSDLMSLTNTISEGVKAHPLIQWEALSALVRMLAPVAPAFAEECWSMLHPSSPALFESPSFPKVDDTLSMLQPRMQSCAVQVNGRLRCVVEVPQTPKGLEGERLQHWVVDAILKTAEGKEKLRSGKIDVTKAKKTIVVKGGKTVNFVL